MPSQTAPPPRMVNLCQATQTTILAPNPMLQGAILMQQMQGTVWITLEKQPHLEKDKCSQFLCIVANNQVHQMMIRLKLKLYSFAQVTCGTLGWVGSSSVSSSHLGPGHLCLAQFPWAWLSSLPSWVSQLHDLFTHMLATIAIIPALQPLLPPHHPPTLQ